MSEREPLTQAECEAVLLQVINLAKLARLVPEELLAKYIDDANHVDTIAPMLDPTAWMAGHRKNDIFKKMAVGLMAFKRALPSLEEAVEADRVAEAYGRAPRNTSAGVFDPESSLDLFRK